MNDRQIRTFINVAEQKSFSGAAAMSYISVSALISQMKNLEKDLQLTLFNKSTHGVTLTREGEFFLTAAKKLTSIYDNAVEQSRNIRIKPVLKVGLVSFEGELIRSYIMKYQAEHPEMEVFFADVQDDEAVKALMDGRAQVIFCPEYADIDESKVEFIPVLSENYNISVSAKHVLAQKDFLTAADLLPYDINVYDCPAWRVDPVSYLLERNVKIKVQKQAPDRNKFLNMILGNEIFVTVGMVPGGSTLMTAKIPTDIPAGNYGFMIRRDADDPTREFVEKYLNQEKSDAA